MQTEHKPKHDPAKVFKSDADEFKKFKGCKLKEDGFWYFGSIGPFDTLIEAYRESCKIKMFGKRKF